MNDILTKATKITKQINNAKLRLRKLQDSCTHENADGEYRGNTGNWDRVDDLYWIDILCNDCLKKYRLYSNEPGYREFKGNIVERDTIKRGQYD